MSDKTREVWLVFVRYSDVLNNDMPRLDQVVSERSEAEKYAQAVVRGGFDVISVNIQGWFIDGTVFLDQVLAGNMPLPNLNVGGEWRPDNNAELPDNE